MAHLKIPDEDRPIDDDREIQARLEAGGIEYQKWTPTPPLEPGAPDDDVLAAYAGKIPRAGFPTTPKVALKHDTNPCASVLITQRWAQPLSRSTTQNFFTNTCGTHSS